MADLKSIANMQIGGPKYPKKRRINLYQKQNKKGKIAAEVYGEVLAEYAHYGNGYLNEEESKLPDRRMMLDSLKSQIFPLTAVSSVSITSDQMSLEGTIPNGTLFPQLVRDAEADPNARYVTASLEETVKKDGEERVLASLKQVGVSMAVFFNEPEEGKEE